MRVAVIDDHPLVRDAVADHIARLPGDHSAKGFGTVDGFNADLDAGASYDLVLLDLGLPGFTSLQALEQYRSQHDDIPVVVLSATCDADTIRRALDIGAMGFIPKTSPGTLLKKAIELVASGGIYIPPEALTRDDLMTTVPRVPAQSMQRESAGGPGRGASAGFGAGSGLTLRQREVLNLLIQGMPNKVICRELNLSANTVKSHLSAIFRVLDVANRTQAVIAAERLGFRVKFGSAQTAR